MIYHDSCASSTKRQTAFTSRICSTDLQSASSRRGAHTSTTRHWARKVDVDAVAVEGEADAARGVLRGRAGHRDEDDRRLLPLELVHRPHADARG